MDDLQEFLKHQKALAEMPEGDIEQYEARVRQRVKRRKLWRSDDDPSEEEHSASELSTHLRSMISDDMPLGGHLTKSPRSPSRCGDGLDGKGSSALGATGEGKSGAAGEDLMISRSKSTRKLRDDSNYQSAGRSGSESSRPGLDYFEKGQMSPIADSRLATAGGSKEDGGVVATMQDQNASGPSGSSETPETKISNNQMSGVKERVVKKRKTSGANSSNITSPSSTLAGGSTSSAPLRTLRSKRIPKTELNERSRKKAERDKRVAARKQGEELEKRMTPREYAIHVQSKFADYLAGTPPEKLPFRGKAIFYIGGDYSTASQSTRRKMDHLRKKGATIVPSYNPEVVTHVITEGNAAVTLKALGLKSLDEIPMYIPTLTWNWVTEGKPDSPEFWFAAFPSRIDASSERRPEYVKSTHAEQVVSLPRAMSPTYEDYSHIADFTGISREKSSDSIKEGSPDDRKSTQVTERGSDNDPLAEFYEQARKDLQAEKELSSSGTNSEVEELASTKEGKKSKWTCDQRPDNGARCVNQDIVDKLSELEEINKTKVSGDAREQKWRVFSYGKSIRAIRAHPRRIKNYEDAISIRGVGAKTAQKIVEIIKTGDLKRIKYDNTEDVQAVKFFTNIYGVGLGTAQKWYAMGCRTLEDVRNKKGGIKLSEVQEIGLKYYDDINTRIHRCEVEEIFNMIKSIALGIDSKLFFQLMGSYRRGAKTCGDIDILMTRPTDDGRTHRGVLRRLLRELHLQGILTEDLAIPEDFEDLEQTYRGLCRRDEKGPRRRIDFLVVPYHERGGALIYYTGDDIFNRAIRLKAKSMGYSLSQHGLAKRATRDSSGKRMVPVELIASETEEEIFRILGVPWQEPHERVRALPANK